MALVKRNHFAASPGILLRISVGLAGFAQKQRVMFVEVITAHLEDAPMDLNARNKKRRRIRVGSWPWVGVENVKKMKNQKISRTGGFGRLQNAVQSRAKKACRCALEDRDAEVNKNCRAPSNPNIFFLSPSGERTADPGYCFLENVQDPKNPTKNCFSDVEWSATYSRYYSHRACLKYVPYQNIKGQDDEA